MARSWDYHAKRRDWGDEGWQGESEWKRHRPAQGRYDREGGDRGWHEEEEQPARPSGRVPWRSSGRVPWRAPAEPSDAGEGDGEGFEGEGEGEGEGEPAEQEGDEGEPVDAAGAACESDAEEQEMMRGLDELRQSLQEPEEGAEEPAAEEEPVQAPGKIPAWRGRAEEARQRSRGGGRRRVRSPARPRAERSGGCVVLTGVPLGYEHSTLVEMHQTFGLEAGALLSAEFGEHEPEEDAPGTQRVVLEYADEASAQLAAGGLDGQLVQAHDGRVQALRAELRDAAPPPRSSALPAVRLSGVPDSFTEEMVRELHEGTGVADADVVSVELLDASGETRACVVRYQHGGAAARAARALEGKRVLTASGAQRRLVAGREEAPGAPSGREPPPPPRAPARAPRSPPREARRPPEAPERGGGGGARRGSWRAAREERAEQEILPSVYISDVPTELSDDVLIDLHKGPGGEDAEIVAIKHLPAKDPLGETRCCIVRYRSQAAADRAIEALSGTQVLTTSGRPKFLGARLAKPAQWMREKGASSPPRLPAPPPAPGRGSSGSGQRWADAAEGPEPPLDVPLKGTVKTWYEEKGFGFASVDDYRVDIFVHRKVLHVSRPMLSNGERVLLKVGWDSAKGKYHATACEVFGDAGEDASPPPLLCADGTDGPPLNVPLVGTVRTFTDKGFGFILPDDFQVEVFVHRNDLVGGTALGPNDRVSFQVGWDSTKGKHSARLVEVIADGGGSAGAAAAPSGSAAGRGATLLIGGLPSDVQEDLVESLVAAFCEVRRIRIALDPKGGKDELGPSKAALVDVASEEEARAAEAAVSEATWVGESLRVRVCRPDSHAPQNKLYVSGLPLAMKEANVEELFSQHGSVSQVAILPTKGWGQSALVTLADVEEASLTAGLFDQHIVEGHQVPLTVRFAKPEGGLVPGRSRARAAAEPELRPRAGPSGGAARSRSPRRAHGL